jgi:hypothetical protein
MNLTEVKTSEDLTERIMHNEPIDVAVNKKYLIARSILSEKTIKEITEMGLEPKFGRNRVEVDTGLAIPFLEYSMDAQSYVSGVLLDGCKRREMKNAVYHEVADHFLHLIDKYRIRFLH